MKFKLPLKLSFASFWFLIFINKTLGSTIFVNNDRHGFVLVEEKSVASDGLVIVSEVPNQDVRLVHQQGENDRYKIFVDEGFSCSVELRDFSVILVSRDEDGAVSYTKLRSDSLDYEIVNFILSENFQSSELAIEQIFKKIGKPRTKPKQ